MAQKDRKLTAHDYFFKQLFADSKHVRAFIEGEFPQKFVRQLDLTTLQADESHVVNSEMKEYAADVLYICRYAGKTNLRLAFLLEHKSYVPEYPHLQLLRYMLNLWEKDVQEKRPLRPVMPVIVYHGTGQWHLRSFADYFGQGVIDEFLTKFLPSFDYWLTNLQERPKEKIQQQFDAELRAALLLMKFIYDPKLLEKLEDVFREARDLQHSEQGQTYLQELILYIHQGSKLKTIKIQEAMKNYLLEMEPDEGTSAWELEQKGRSKGKQEERLEVAKKMKQEGSSTEFICKVTGLTEEEVKAL
jgi:predicted transposase/invertase (TIGR01784 family)